MHGHWLKNILGGGSGGSGGGGEGGSVFFPIENTGDQSRLNATWNELYAAVESGKVVMCGYVGENSVSVLYLISMIVNERTMRHEATFVEVSGSSLYSVTFTAGPADEYLVRAGS